MATDCNIPSEVKLSDHGGDWETYIASLYKLFSENYIDHTVKYNAKNVNIITEKMIDGKVRSFWHIITEGQYDDNRIPNLDRCSKVHWARHIIEESGECIHYKTWIKYHDKTGRNRYYIWCDHLNYIVIFEDRHTHYTLITAYVVDKYREKKYKKEYEMYKKTKTPA